MRHSQYFLLLRDPSLAAEVAREGLEHFPDSNGLWRAYIQALSQGGREGALLEAWKCYSSRFPEQSQREVLEEVAWGVLRQGCGSRSPLMRLYALLGAAVNADRHAVPLVVAGLEDGSTVVRQIAARVAVLFPDQPVRERLLRLLESEHHQEVRLSLIQAVGQMGLKEALPLLMRRLSAAQGSQEEAAVLMEALEGLMDTVGREDLVRLGKSGRSGLRILACHLAAARELEEGAAALEFLSRDHHSRVRAAYYEMVGFLRLDQKERLLEGLTQIDPLTSTAAAWALAIQGHGQGESFLRKRLSTGPLGDRRLAAAAVAALGERGIEVMRWGLETNTDPYVRLSLAMGLLVLDEELPLACEVVRQVLQENREPWHWRQRGLVWRELSPLKGQAPFPELTDQMVRLELLSLLAVKGDGGALEGVRCFLRNLNWGVGATAAVVLLSEGGEEALEVVARCLEDEDSRVRTHAALVLALWGKDPRAVATLQNHYADADRITKERILEGLGQVGGSDCLPFLVKALDEPFQGLRLLGASSILKALN